DVLVLLAVAVVVLVVAGGVVRRRLDAVVLAALSIAVEIDVVLRASGEGADPGLPLGAVPVAGDGRRIDVQELRVAVVRAGSAGDDRVEVDVLVDQPVAVVVDPIADLVAAVGRHAARSAPARGG